MILVVDCQHFFVLGLRKTRPLNIPAPPKFETDHNEENPGYLEDWEHWVLMPAGMFDPRSQGPQTEGKVQGLGCLSLRF